MADKVVRDIAKVDAEYDKDKYSKLLKYYLADTNISMPDIREHEYNLPIKRALADTNISMPGIKEHWYNLPKKQAKELRDKRDNIMIETFKRFLGSSDTLVELGCGYGYNLYCLALEYPDKIFIGGDYSQNAVKLGSLLGVDIMPFNFYDNKWGIMERVRNKATIFTMHAIEQLPLASPFVTTLSKYKSKIDKVIHLEPIYELHPPTGPGEERRKYAIQNDYNTDLLTEILKQDAIIEYQEYGVLETRFLNPTSLLVWRYR